jgi:hypothetical protein
MAGRDGHRARGDVRPDGGTFRLPPEHAAWLTRAAGPDDMSIAAQYIPGLGAVEDDVVACFRQGGGLPYARYPRFHEVMAEDSGQSVLSALESHVLPLVPGLRGALGRGIRALDVGCGRGLIMIRLAELFPGSRFVGTTCRTWPSRSRAVRRPGAASATSSSSPAT